MRKTAHTNGKKRAPFVGNIFVPVPVCFDRINESKNYGNASVGWGGMLQWKNEHENGLVLRGTAFTTNFLVSEPQEIEIGTP
jgi:hypothetical protein